MLKKILTKIFEIIKNIGIVIISFIGFSFTKAKTVEEKNEDSSDDNGGTVKTKPITIPTFKDDSEKAKPITSKKVTSKKEETKYNEREYPYLGIKIYNDEYLNVIISKVEENSLADKAGFKEGDILIKINDIQAEGEKTFVFIEKISKYEDKDMKINYIHNNEEIEIIVLGTEKMFYEEEIIPEEIKEDKVYEEKQEVMSEKHIIEENIYMNSELIIEKPKEEENEMEFQETAKPSISAEPLIISSGVVTENKELKKENIEHKNSKKEEKIEKEKKKEYKKEEKTEKIKDERKQDKEEKKEEKKEDPRKKEVKLIHDIVLEDQKEKEKKITFSSSKKKTVLELLKTDNRFKMQYLPFMIFKRRMVRNMYKAHLLSNSLISARKALGEEVEYRKVNYEDLLFKSRTTSNFIDLTYDNLYNIDMLKMELKKEYGTLLKTDPILIETMDRINYLEERTIARYQRLIEHKKELDKKHIKRKILVKEEIK